MQVVGHSDNTRCIFLFDCKGEKREGKGTEGRWREKREIEIHPLVRIIRSPLFLQPSSHSYMLFFSFAVFFHLLNIAVGSSGCPFFFRSFFPALLIQLIFIFFGCVRRTPVTIGVTLPFFFLVVSLSGLE